MGLEDRESLRILRDAVDPARGSDELIRRFYTRWFAIDMSARDLFPPDMADQRMNFGKALAWFLGELVDRRAHEPVSVLAQLGRDHRKYGVTQRHYDSLQSALLSTLRSHLITRWNDRLEEAAHDAVALAVGIMRGAADAEKGPAYRDGTVIEHLRVTRDVSVIRLQLDAPLYYHPGQYVMVQVPQWPRRWRYLSPSIPADRGGAIEFHVRAVPGGMISPSIVAETRPGDRWRISSPHGGLHVDRDGGDVLMIAGSTGLAPLRTLIMDLTRKAVNPRVHLFFGGRFPCDLYDLRTLWHIAAQNPWLSVTPVSEYSVDPPWAKDYPDVQPPRGLHVRQTGVLADVVTRYGNWSDRQILISGNPDMIRATKEALLAKGTPAERIQHDPLP
ncbi:oxidoreductase NAD-binding domain protein [Mycolicibacterium hassiacum DSM 44199]|uniref:nitric oxide dioxygenase n=1 Tax=Mycolicibacterium hassiacum (strain DSM 44199 / CIP 105218 / JCM 12690 / 3849) TaxID=1122247 RepID=K5BH70_MYCHD|nr:FAD-binding oxidoreductase [Mycolicibacterium hassiacum]EKF25417.1 oxidoreductase NAD-binding domain protein [Mycolicibacterium hassiacum DSM 44199]MBX5485293.1 2-polyprenylphenol hydroxylase [Mycolicibacterium hassiacum]MDA4086125.1 monooxygenase [Mycolicibacterium hassiacum DSM 44199]PZN23986.1 MAG: 2-polyprenylphenol hydroxylase [Mycolicibacterium hassiacum]VCT92943.1 Ferredoxin--NAD(P)(+) reductase (naphthalene dioxygenase/salicylate 5-hydroxylase ferredoxin-specific) [Mycolicibacterium